MNDKPTDTPRPKSEVSAAPKTMGEGKEPKKSPTAPTLVAYFGAKPIAPTAYFKVLRAAKIERFAADDLAAAAAAAADTDGTGARLLALAAQPGKPKAVDRWVWSAIQAFLRTKIPGAFEVLEPDADATFRNIHRALNHRLADPDTERQKQAHILLALSLTWLASQRSLNIVGALELLRDSFTESDGAKRELVRKAIADGKVGTLKRLAAIVGLFDGAARDARAALEAERQRRAATEAQLNDAKTTIGRLAAQVEELILARDRFATEAADAAKKLDEGQQHAGHDIVELKARQAAFLKRRISPLLSDAVDALEIEPPAPHIAIGRLKSAIDAIGDSTE